MECCNNKNSKIWEWLWNGGLERSKKRCKDFEECANENLKCLEHKDLKENEENLIEIWSLAILLPVVMYKVENVPKELGDLAENFSEQSI